MRQADAASEDLLAWRRSAQRHVGSARRAKGAIVLRNLDRAATRRRPRSMVPSLGSLRPVFASAEDKVRCEPRLAGLLVLRGHVAAGVGEGLDGRVEVDTMPRG